MGKSKDSTMAAPRILIVTTSHGQMGETGHATGLWAEDASPYFALRESGADITIASIAGGDVPSRPRHPVQSALAVACRSTFRGSGSGT